MVKYSFVVKYSFEQRVFICNTFANYASRFALNGNVNNLRYRYSCSKNPPAVYLEVPLRYKEGLWCAMCARKITKAHILTYNNFTFQNTNLVHNSFNLQQYICYTTLLNMFRAARCSSSGGPTVSPQPMVSSPSVSSRTGYGWRALHPHTVRLLTEGDDTIGCGDTIGPPDDEQRAARNMLRSVV